MRPSEKLCLSTFFFLGNYFAMIGLFYARRAGDAQYAGDLPLAAKMDARARAWALWGLIPSTAINAALLYLTYLLMRWIWTSFSGMYSF